MITDARTLFSEDQAVTASAASTNSIDLKALGVTYDGVQLLRKQGVKHIPIFVGVTTSFATLTSLDIQIQSDNDSAFGSPTTLLSINVPVASLVAGYQIPIDFLPIHSERYLRLNYNVNGSNASAGKIEAGIVTAVDRAYRG